MKSNLFQNKNSKNQKGTLFPLPASILSAAIKLSGTPEICFRDLDFPRFIVGSEFAENLDGRYH